MTRLQLKYKLRKNGIREATIGIPFGGARDTRFRVAVTYIAVYIYNPKEYFHHDLVQEQMDNGQLYDEIWEWVKAGIKQGKQGKTYVLTANDFPCLKKAMEVME